MPKVLILTGDAAESLEVMYPYQRLLEEGYEVEIAAPSKKKLQFVVHDFVDGYDTYTEKPGYTWDADLAFADVEGRAIACAPGFCFFAFDADVVWQAEFTAGVAFRF